MHGKSTEKKAAHMTKSLVRRCHKLRAGERDPACGRNLGSGRQLQQPGTALVLPANTEGGSSGCQVTAGSHSCG